MQRHGKNACFLTDRGFTLTELLVAMGVFATVAAIAIPNFTALVPTYRLNGAARQVFSDLMWARGQAVEQNVPVVVTFPSATSYTIAGGTVNITKNIQGNYPTVTVNKNGGDPDPTFSSRGTAGAQTTITITNPSGARTVTVRATGVTNID